jgi:hypothetical protein
MDARLAVHPSEDALRAFALGKLDDSTSSVLMNHLDSCRDCCKVVAALSGDDFLDRLRQAHGHSSTLAPAKSLADDARVAKPNAGLTPIANLPPELAANEQYEILSGLWLKVPQITVADSCSFQIGEQRFRLSAGG